MTDSDADWYLRHRDGVEHGPFRFADIVAAAKQGNIAADTCVRHEAKTLGQWVFAPRVQPIADVLSSVAPKPAAARPSRTPTQASPTARRTVAPTSMGSATSNPSNPSNASNASNPTFGEPVKAVEANKNLETVPIVRTSREHGYPVPKTFLNACFALIDFRFHWFVTPWIVKILWPICLTGMILWSGQLLYDYSIPAELAVADATEVDAIAANATSLDLAAAKETTGKWQFEPLGGQPLLQSQMLGLMARLSALLVGLLCVRVACEAAIVLMRVAGDLNELKNRNLR